MKGVIKSLRRSSLRPAQQKLTITAVLALRTTEALRRSARAGGVVRPANQFRIALQESLHRRTFQSWHEIEEAFELIGISGFTARLKAAYSVSNILPTRNQLNNIVNRRHQIVHEGDLVRHQRGGRCRVHEITPGYVKDSLAFLDAFVERLDTVR